MLRNATSEGLSNLDEGPRIMLRASQVFQGLYLVDCSIACQKKNLIASLTTLLMPFIRPQWVNYEVKLNQTKYFFRLIIGIFSL
jgi:hypothetical protein